MPALRLAACLLLFIALTGQAQLYRWVDEKGRVQYTGTPPPAGTKNVQIKKLNPALPGSAAQPYVLQMALKNSPVQLYSSPDCGPACDDARKLLNQRGIPFSEISISDQARLDELKTISGGTTVPVLLVGQSLQKGFLAESYNAALDGAGYPSTGLLRPRDQAAPTPPPASEKVQEKQPVAEPPNTFPK